jgi:hypothetical protein
MGSRDTCPNNLIPRLDVDIGARNWKLESAFLNSVVWLYMELRFGIRETETQFSGFGL